jgi:hypothetical protein
VFYEHHERDLLKSVNQSTLLGIASTCNGNKRMKYWPIKVLRIHMTNSMDDWDHL